MNARDNIKPKTIRLAILMALADGAIATIDDLQDRMDEPRAKIASNVHPTMAEGLIKRLRDDVTSLPAYQITPKGREYLASFAGGKAEAAEQAVITPGVKVEIPTHACPAPTTDDLVVGAAFPSDIAVKEAVIANLQKRWNEALSLTVNQSEEIALITSQRDAWRDAIGEISGEDTPQSAAQFISELKGRVGGINSRQEEKAQREIADLRKQLAHVINEANAAIELSRRARASAEPVGYVIQRPAKPLVRFSKAEKAQARALCFARSGQRAQVFALVPDGVAVPGAEWRPA